MPHRIGRYEVINRIGQGGMGSLYLARDPLLDRPLAIKVLSSDDPELRQRFAREARSAASLKHPNIVTLYDVGTDEGRPFIAMEYIDGETMGETIRRQAPLPLSRKLQLLIELCDGLGYAHRRGIIHRDIKPANLMITAEGVLKILDFGIARVATSEVATGLTRTGMMVGTVHYMSPEQIEGTRLDQRSDIFAVGLVSYELISGRKAYGGATHEVLYKIMHRQPQPLDEISPGLDPDLYDGINKAISKSPDDRHQTLETFGEELRRIRARIDETSEAATFIEPRPPRSEAPTNRSTDSGSPIVTPTPAPRPPDTASRRQLQIEEHLRQAQQHYASGAFEAAIEQCEQAILLDPKDPRALDLLQQSHLASDDRYASQRVSEAADALTVGRVDEAEALLNQALEVRPESSDALALQRRIQELRQPPQRPAERAKPVEPPKPATVETSRSVDAKTRPPLARMVAAAAVLLTVAIAGMWGLGWLAGTPPDPGRRPDSVPSPQDAAGGESARGGNPGGPVAAVPPPGDSPDQLVALASAAFKRGNTPEAIDLSVKALGRSPGFEPATRLLQTIVAQAQRRASDARAAAVAARAESDPNFGTASAQFAAAQRLTTPAAAAKAVALYAEAEGLYRAASVSAVPIDELMRRADAARRSRDNAQVIELALQIQARDRNHAGARALIAGVLKEADGAAAAARAAALNANAGSTTAFQRADARVSEARSTADPRKQLAALSDAATLFRDAERSAPAAPPPSPAPPPPADATVRARSLLDDAEAALKRGALDEAERHLSEIDAELKARNTSLSTADEARRTVVANGIRSRRSEETRRADVAAIRSTINEYKDAYEKRELERLLAVAPYLRRQRTELAAFFKDIKSLTLKLTTSEPEVDGRRATVTFDEELTFVPEIRVRKPDPIKRQGQWLLVKNASTGGWTLDGVR